jgi:hypothetical protein
LAEDNEKTPRWQAVRLLFVRSLREPGEADAGKKGWALFLTIDVHLSMSKMLETYALRWGIEVFFKEAKQHLGFLKVQTATFASHTASIHLCVIRDLMLMQDKFSDRESRVGEFRSTIQQQLGTLSFAGRLRQIFRSIISGALHELRKRGCSKEIIVEMIGERVNTFFVRSLQLDAVTLRLDYE